MKLDVGGSRFACSSLSQIGKGFQAETDTPFPRLLCGPKRLGNLAQALRLGLRPEGPRELSPGFSLGRLHPHGSPVGASDQGVMDRECV
jgi:hypothetical protein